MTHIHTFAVNPPTSSCHCSIALLYICLLFILPPRHRFIKEKISHSNSSCYDFRLNVLERTTRFGFTRERGEKKSRDGSLWGGLERSTRLRIFSLPAAEGRERERRRGGYLTPVSPPPAPYEVDLGRKEPKKRSWDAEITRDSGSVWRSVRAGVDAHGLLFLFYSRDFFYFLSRGGDWGSARLIRGEKEYKRTGGIIAVFYTRPPSSVNKWESGYNGFFSTGGDAK